MKVYIFSSEDQDFTPLSILDHYKLSYLYVLRNQRYNLLEAFFILYRFTCSEISSCPKIPYFPLKDPNTVSIISLLSSYSPNIPINPQMGILFSSHHCSKSAYKPITPSLKRGSCGVYGKADDDIYYIIVFVR